jgi:hypothetical protein
MLVQHGGRLGVERIGRHDHVVARHQVGRPASEDRPDEPHHHQVRDGGQEIPEEVE